MIGTKLGWLAVELVLAAFFLYFGSVAALILGAVLLAAPLADLAVNLSLRRRLRVGVEAAVSLRKEDPGTVTVRVENPTLFPVLRVRCDVTVQNQLNRQQQTQKVFTHLLPRRTRDAALVLSSRYCGRMRVSVPRIVLYDCFGLMGVTCRCTAVTHMTVLPDTFEPVVTMVPDPSSMDDSETYSQERPGADLSETFQIREYVPGDSIRQIHWKLSNKFDKLIVRDPGLPVSKNVLAFWERTGETDDPEGIDAQAEVMVSLCRSLTDSGIRFTVGWNDTDRNLCVLHRIGTMEEFVGVTPRLLRAAGTEQGISGAGLLLQTRPDALCAHMVYVARQPQPEAEELRRYGHVTMLLCGDTAPDDALCFNGKNYVQQLTEIAI